MFWPSTTTARPLDEGAFGAILNFLMQGFGLVVDCSAPRCVDKAFHNPVYWIRDGFIRSCKAVVLGVDRLGPLLTYQPTSSEVGTNAIQHLVFLDVHFYSSSGTFELGIKGGWIMLF
eukprot:Em0003g948a